MPPETMAKSCLVGALMKGDRVLKPTGDLRIEAGDVIALFAMASDVPEVERLLQVSIDYNGAPRWTVWLVTSEAWISRRADNAATVEAAQLAAEDALRVIAAEILRAVGS